jgi:hypothetical protein
MKRSFSLLLAVLLISMLWSCDEKAKPAEITSLVTFNDEIVKFSIKYPSNWTTIKSEGKGLYCLSDENGKSRFSQYDSEGIASARIIFSTQDIDTVDTFEKIMAGSKRFAPETYSAPQKVKIDGIECIKQTYEFELTDGLFKGEIYYGTKDNQKAALLQFEAFGGTFDAYKPKFDEIVSTLVLPVKPAPKTADTITELIEQDPPSTTLKQVGGEGFTIKIPDNFQKERGQYMGLRRGDCYIRVDVKDASEQANLKKTVDQSKANFRGASMSSTKIAGADAFKITYKPSNQVDGEVYFTMKDGKLFQITINWFKDEEADFKPVFQKSVSTFKFR